MNNAKITGTVTKEITVRGDVKHTYISSGGGGGGGGAASVAYVATVLTNTTPPPTVDIAEIVEV